MRRFNAFLPAIALALSPSPAPAQAYQCTPPKSLPAVPNVRPPSSKTPRNTSVQGYLLALSWSPEFCRTRQESRTDRLQCGGAMGDFGFILHGLWPETIGPAYPRWCNWQKPIPREVLRDNLCTMPSAKLTAKQWAKHGSCMVQQPRTYFRISRTLYQAVRYPDMEKLSRKPLTIGAFREAFAVANPGLGPAMMVVKRNRRGWLQEVRLCLGKSFQPRKCPRHIRRNRANSTLKIWRGL